MRLKEEKLVARERAKYASVRPSQAEEGGGKFTIPAGSVATIREAMWTEWREAGESALKKGREAADPALKLVCDVDGMDDPLTEFLGAGKATRLIPSRDGEHLEPADSSTAGAITKDCNADVFLASVCDTKTQKSMAFDERLLDDGISSLVGLKFVAGRRIVEREMNDSTGTGKDSNKGRPTLYSQENLKLPKSGSASGKEREVPAPSKGRDAEPEPTRAARGGNGADDGAIEEAAEKAVLAALALPKYARGLDKDKAFAAVYNIVRDDPNAKVIAAKCEDVEWITGKRRPWTVDKEGMLESA